MWEFHCGLPFSGSRLFPSLTDAPEACIGQTRRHRHTGTHQPLDNNVLPAFRPPLTTRKPSATAPSSIGRYCALLSAPTTGHSCVPDRSYRLIVNQESPDVPRRWPAARAKAPASVSPSSLRDYGTYPDSTGTTIDLIPDKIGSVPDREPFLSPTKHARVNALPPC